MRPYLEKPFTKTGLVEWLKVKALSSSPSTVKKKTKTLRQAAPSSRKPPHFPILLLVAPNQMPDTLKDSGHKD
jgi:hypothetical protein